MHALVKLKVATAFAASAVPAHAQDVYVVARTLNRNPGAYAFGTVSLQTGAFRSIAVSRDYINVNSLGFGSDGKLYALGSGGTLAHPSVDEYAVDPATGELARQKRFFGASISSAGMDNRGVFTGLSERKSILPDKDGGFTNNIIYIPSKLFTLDPVAQTLQFGAQTTVEPNSLVVADGSGNVYAGSSKRYGIPANILVRITNGPAGAVVFLGSTGIVRIQAGLQAHDVLYAFGGNTSGIPCLYTLNPATGAAKLVAAVSLPNGSFVQAAALAPDKPAAARPAPPRPTINRRAPPP